MASASVSVRDVGTPQRRIKRVYRDRPVDAPIKKRVMAEINLKRRVKLEDTETDKALDLSPGLKHTLAQFTLSSRSSLGGPAAFSARADVGSHQQTLALPLSSPSALGTGPLMMPSDRSTELTHAVLEGESIASFVVGGEKRLCLPQVLNSVLRDFTLQQINGVCDELYVYCARCDANQLHVLKVLGVLPFNAPSCGLITLTDAQRLCNALLRPGSSHSHEASSVNKQFGFQVEHQCLGKCRGIFMPPLYVCPDASCVQCVECRLLFSPQNFVMHSHRTPDKRTCHWGFDSARWPRYLHLSRLYKGTADENKLNIVLEQMKEKFNLHLDTSPNQDPLCHDIKQEVGSSAISHPSYYLYPYDKMVAPNVCLQKNSDCNGADDLGTLQKQHYKRRTHDFHTSAPSVIKEPLLVSVSMETHQKDDDNNEEFEMVHMYNRQREKVKPTPHTELKTEPQTVCDGEAEQWKRLSVEQCDLDAVDTNHTQKPGEILEQLWHTHCTCHNPEEQYTTQLCDLRVRLERAEAERQELQDELRKERDAREKLERLIAHLQQQIDGSSSGSPRSDHPASHSPQSTDSDNHSSKDLTPASQGPWSQQAHTLATTHRCMESF